jgi:hypothetical protein
MGKNPGVWRLDPFGDLTDGFITVDTDRNAITKPFRLEFGFWAGRKYRRALRKWKNVISLEDILRLWGKDKQESEDLKNG